MKDDKNTNSTKGENTIKHSEKSENGREKKLWRKTIKKESKIKVLAHELLASTLSYLMLTPW
jgi:hypothetical protein